MKKDDKNKEKRLNPRQKRFCEEYLIDLNALQAAIRAGYSPHTAGEMGYENLNKPQLRTYIAKLIDERSSRTLVHADFVITNLIEVSQRCLQKIPVMLFDPINKCMMQKKDEEERDVWEFDSSGANKSLELLGKHLKIFTEKIEAKTENTNFDVTLNLSK